MANIPLVADLGDQPSSHVDWTGTVEM